MPQLSKLSFYNPHPWVQKTIVGGRSQAQQQQDVMRADFLGLNVDPTIVIREISATEKSDYREVKLEVEVALQHLLEAGLQGTRLKETMVRYLDLTLEEGAWSHRRARHLWHAPKLSRLKLERLLQTSVPHIPCLVAETLEKYPNYCIRSLQTGGMARLLKKAPGEQRERLIRALPELNHTSFLTQGRSP